MDNSVISAVDLQKFQGKWYEIARLDHRFERDMTHCTALYTLQKDGTIKVVNTGIRENKWKISEGCAKKTATPALLRVSFCGPFYSDYRILMLAPDYSYALIGGSSDKYLWILSRTPQLKLDAKHRILREAQRRGYNTEQLIWVKQK
ncbi:MAG: lipocalin family protein [Bacteroidaceae bacterium]|nr:lipocalin family protein [Bacteroidaceae bacterium]